MSTSYFMENQVELNLDDFLSKPTSINIYIEQELHIGKSTIYDDVTLTSTANIYTVYLYFAA
jgi:hypothetical protein